MTNENSQNESAYGFDYDRLHEVFRLYALGVGDIDLNRREQANLDQVNFYERQYGEPLPNRVSDEARAIKEKAFAEALHLTESRERELSNVEKRLLASGNLALHYLLVSDGIERVYTNYVLDLFGQTLPEYLAEHNIDHNHMPDPDTLAEIEGRLLAEAEQNMFQQMLPKNLPAPAEGSKFDKNTYWAQETLINIKTEAAMAYLERLEAKNYRTTGNLTMGAEYEYTDKFLAHYFTDIVNDLNLDRTAPLDADTLHEIELRIKTANALHPPKAEYAAPDVFPYSEALQINQGYAVRELKTKPTLSPKEQLRDLMYIKKSGLVSGELAPQETYGGVLLDREHLEVMDVRIIGTAGGLYMSPAKDAEIMTSFHKRILLGPSDPYTKFVSLPDGSICYFPLFKPRFESEMQTDPSSRGKHTFGVEWRALPAIDPTWESFSAHVSRDLYQYYANEAIVCAQMPEDVRSPLEQTRAALWNDFKESWEQLMLRYKLTPLADDEKYIRLDTDPSIFRTINGVPTFDPYRAVERVSTNAYGAHLGLLRIYAQQNPAFEAEVKELINVFEHNVAATLA